jgi:hypothetical protein
MKALKTFQLLYIAVWAVVIFNSPALAQDTALPKADIDTVLKDFSQLNDGNKNMILTAAGIPQVNSFDWGKTVAGIIFGGIGFVAFVYGKKNALWRPMVIGIVLMAYPYFVSGTVAFYLLGIGLSAALFFWRE